MTNDGKTFEREVCDLIDDINEFVEKELKYFEKQEPFLKKIGDKGFIYQRPPNRWEEGRLVEIRKRWVRLDSGLDSYLLKVSALYERVPECEIKLKDILEKTDAKTKSLKEIIQDNVFSSGT